MGWWAGFFRHAGSFKSQSVKWDIFLPCFKYIRLYNVRGWDLLVSPFALGVYGVDGVLDQLLKNGSIFCHGDVVREGVLHSFLRLR